MLSFFRNVYSALRTSVHNMILTLYLCRTVVMLRNSFYECEEGSLWVVVVVAVILTEQYLPSVSLFHTHITLFLYVIFFIYTQSPFLFSLRLLKSFFSCHRHKYNIYCFFFTHSFVYSFIYIFSLPTPQRLLCHPTRFQNMISVLRGSWFKRMPFPIQPTEPESFQRKWYS